MDTLKEPEVITSRGEFVLTKWEGKYITYLMLFDGSLTNPNEFPRTSEGFKDAIEDLREREQ